MFHSVNSTIVILLCSALLSMLTGCESIRFSAQAVGGHLQLVSKTRSISQVVKQPSLGDKKKKMLQTAIVARRFATDSLGLPDNKSYQRYAELDRKFVTWVVAATDEFSMQPVQSCFPVVGCLSYRGYFSKVNAQKFAQQLKQQGKEVYINGSPAYSTLGWFSDPIVSPMLNYGELSMLETMFHELAHQRLYFKNDSEFNEAFATMIGQYGVRTWLRDHKPELSQRYSQAIVRRVNFQALLRKSADELKLLYASKQPPTIMRAKKQKIMRQLKVNYAGFKRKHHYKGYDNWFKTPVNNPRLAMISVYEDLVPEFLRWFKACDNDLERFYQTMKTFEDQGKKLRHKRLRMKAQCKV